MVDDGRVTRLLRSLDERVGRLRAAAEATEPDRTALWFDAVKYQLVTGIECCVDVAHHFGSSEGWGPVDSNAEALRRMGTHAVIDSDLAASLARAVGFRNVLVHRYVEVDNRVVESALDRLDEFEAFVSQIAAWLVENGGPSTT